MSDTEPPAEQHSPYQDAYSESGFREKLSRYARVAGREVVEKALLLYYAMQEEKAPAWARQIAEINPLVPILRLYRHALTPLQTDLSVAFVAAAAWAVALLAIGGMSFIRYEGRMARYL